MKTHKRRGLLAKAGALLAVAALALSASPSYAQTLTTPTTSDVIITKLKQGPGDNTDTKGGALTALPSQPIDGVTYEAYAVPLQKPVGSNEWQAEIAGITVADAAAKVEAAPNLTHKGVTGDEGDTGQIRWNDMPQGLYLVRETETPGGVVASRDFLIAVPMTDPQNNSKWLDEIYIYPKSAMVTATMTVENATDFSVGDTVTWTVKADIPQIRDTATNVLLPTDKFVIEVPLNDADLFIDDKAKVTIPGLTAGDHYVVDFDTTTFPGQTIVKVTLTEDGRMTLVGLLGNNQKEINVKIDTEVMRVGAFNPGATIFTGDTQNSYDADNSTAKVSYGDIKLIKSSTNEDASVADAQFRVYLTEQGATERNGEEYSDDNPDGFLKTLERSDGLWITNEDGEVTIGGLRYSNLANGVAVGEEPGMQYWLAEVKAPADQQLLAKPISFEIKSFGGIQTLQATNTANTNAFVLPLTGGTGTALLTILGLGILAIVVFVARARRNADA